MDKIKKPPEAEEKRIGLFGGTFNPIHLGHLRGVEEIREAFGLRKVIFIPAAIPPHKANEGVIEARHRLKMVRLATATNPFFSTTDLELKRPGTSYSIDTIRHFQKKYQKSLFFIMGRDAFVDIETWKDFQHLFFYCNFIVMTRPRSQKMPSSPQLPEALVSAFQYHQQSKSWIHTSKHTLYFKEISYLDISSTKVRKLIQKGRSARYLIPPGVETYIQRYGLYQKGG